MTYVMEKSIEDDEGVWASVTHSIAHIDNDIKPRNATLPETRALPRQ